LLGYAPASQLVEQVPTVGESALCQLVASDIAGPDPADFRLNVDVVWKSCPAAQAFGPATPVRSAEGSLGSR
jgi:hypothetical protein